MSRADEPDERLDDFTKEEWWEVAQKACPTITAAEFEQLWAEFVADKARRKLQ